MEPEHGLQELYKVKLDFIEDVTKRADEFQTQVLSEILTRNSDVEYLQRHGLSGRTDRESFKKALPVITYEDIFPDLKRIAEGDKSPVFTSQPASMFFTSSGTSGGETKLFPGIEEDMERASFFFSFMMPVMSKYMPGLEKGKGLYFFSTKRETTTPGGLPARPFLTSYFKSSQFRDRNRDYANYTSPDEAVLCSDSKQSLYCHMLCGLSENQQVLRVGEIFASGLIHSIRFLEKNWTQLCHDIRTGTISPLVTDLSVREVVMKILKPDPELADFIESECSKESWKGIIPRLWPNTKYIETIITGSMSQYIPVLEYYTDGRLPIVTTIYGSSECLSGINLNPLCKPDEVAFTLIPVMGYFEFLPVQRDNQNETNQQDLVDLVDVKLGHEYELVVTTYAGLYRHRVGDVLRVAGYKNKAPQFNFVGRKNVILSLDNAKTDEAQLLGAVKNAVNHLLPYDVRVTDYTSCADTLSNPGHYIIYWELTGRRSLPPSVIENCCLIIEESLDNAYRYKRFYETIGPLEIKIVENGTFEELMNYAISRGASMTQYKTPRCLKAEPMIQILNLKIISCHFSPKCPKWTSRGLEQWNKEVGTESINQTTDQDRSHHD